MRVLVCGARGFIGAALCERLAREGHDVVKGVRRAIAPDELAIDYAADCDPRQWLPRLQGVDTVVNAVGIIVERGDRSFERVHHRAPEALFRACGEAGVRRIVQISALGADSGATAYFASKRAADQCVLEGPVASTVIRPALVFGPAGTSARWFRALASLPVQLLPGGGNQPLRPVHIDDVSELVARILRAEAGVGGNRAIDLPGGTQTSYRGMLAIYRTSMGLPRAASLSVPAWAMRAAGTIGDRIPGAVLTSDTWRMLEAGSTGDIDDAACALGRAPRGIETFIGPAERRAARLDTLAFWRGSLLRAALAMVWLVTAFVSAFVYPRAASLALLASVNLHGLSADAALYGACALDFTLGVATWVRPGRTLWWTQIALILAYSVVIAVCLPDFLAHPFGPILKNIPILAILLVLLGDEVNP